MIARLRIAILRAAAWLAADADQPWQDAPLPVLVAEQQRRGRTGSRPVGGWW